MEDLDALFARLAKSSFRQRFHLSETDRQYLRKNGLSAILRHAETFIEQRLAPAAPANDGKQTPYRGHPVFIAQHATATCCRGCLQKWHRVPKGHQLTEAETRYVITVLERWLTSRPE
jgi:hypothetical protein